MYLLKYDLSGSRKAEGVVIPKYNADNYQTYHGDRIDPMEPSGPGIPDKIR